MSFIHFLVAFLLLATARPLVNAKSTASGVLLTPKQGCGISKVSNSRIVGGSPAKIGAWPWLVLVGFSDQEETIVSCGGSLITSRHVLSAAHCMNPLMTFVRLGEYDTTTDKETSHVDIQIARYKSHSAYDGITHDIAIVYMKRDVRFTDFIRPICLPINEPIRSSSFVNSNAFAAGWGLTEEGGQASYVLMQVQVPVINNTVCRNLYKKHGNAATETDFGERVICAGSLKGGKSTCNGDSGGPLMLPIQNNGTFPFYQIGLVSYAIGCARKNFPTVYTSIQHHIDWIKLNL